MPTMLSNINGGFFSMLKSRVAHFILGLTLVITLLVGFGGAAVFADTTPTPTATPIPVELKLSCDVPSYSDNAGSTFNYNVTLSYSGADTITVNLSATNDPGWTSLLSYSAKQISSIPIGPLSYGSPDTRTLSVSYSANTGTTPTIGPHKLIIKATSGSFSKELELTAIVKSYYSISLTTPSGNLATSTISGKENTMTMRIVNNSSVALENVTVNAQKPDNWEISFKPDSKIASIPAGQSADVSVVIKPPKDTITGDYNITLSANDSNISQSMVIRVMVSASSIWGFLSIAIIVVVIAGLAFLFMKLGRR
jgi:uncharacterized membrane protein